MGRRKSHSKAAVSAICESTKRDAIALTWLARLPLPRLERDEAPPAAVAAILDARKGPPLESHLFDATTDMGVPTVCLVQCHDGRPIRRHFLGCSTEFAPWAACAKVIREAAVGRTAMGHHQDIPDDPRHFARLEDGAVFMGRPEQAGAYDFLLRSEGRRPISSLRIDAGADPASQFRRLVRRFRELGREMTLVDLTTDDLREAGLHAFRAFCPDLMPLDFIPSARYTAHPRLFDYPVAAGFGPRDRAALNPFPQPFA